MAEELTELKAPLGIYMVPGNHEYISGIDKSIQFIQNTPIQLLRDSVVTLPCGIQLIGRDDRSNARRLPLQKLMARIDKSKTGYSVGPSALPTGRESGSRYRLTVQRTHSPWTGLAHELGNRPSL